MNSAKLSTIYRSYICTILKLESKIEKLKEEKAYLFKEEAPTGTGGSKGNPPRGGNEPKVENLKDALSQHYKES